MTPWQGADLQVCGELRGFEPLTPSMRKRSRPWLIVARNCYAAGQRHSLIVPGRPKRHCVDECCSPHGSPRLAPIVGNEPIRGISTSCHCRCDAVRCCNQRQCSLACPHPRRPRQHGQCPGQSLGDLPAVGAAIRPASLAGARTRTPVPQAEPRGRVLAPAVSRRRRAK